MPDLTAALLALHRDAYADTADAGSSCTAGCGAWPCKTVRVIRDTKTSQPPASTLPLAAGNPLVQGRCPACGWATLFLADGGYLTCSRLECPRPDAASTLLEHDPRTPADPGLRDRIRRAVCEAEGFGWDTDMLEPDEYGEVADAVLAVLPAPADRATVLAEVVAWLTKKAGEYRSTRHLQHANVADAILMLASKIQRGAVRTNNLHGADLTLLEPAAPADRADVLREAADAVFALEYDVMVGEEGDENLGSMREAWDVGTIHASQLLRRMADQAQQDGGAS